MFDKGTVIMGGDPAPDVSAEGLKADALRAETEKELADAYAMASNKAWWVEDDVYDFNEGTPEYKEARRITAEWFAVEELIRNKIFEILRAEGVNIPKRGYNEVLVPFMDRNGYRDGSGWWVRK